MIATVNEMRKNMPQNTVRVVHFLASAALAGLFTACASEPICDYDEEPYMSADSIPALQAPDGLTAPDRTAALVIPPAAAGAPEKPSGKGRCLDRPPSYFQTGSQPDAAATPTS